MENLPLRDKLLDRTGDVFDGHARIDAVLVVKVDAVSPEPLE